MSVALLVLVLGALSTVLLQSRWSITEPQPQPSPRGAHEISRSLPINSMGTLSEAIGRADPQYKIREGLDGYTANNADQRMKAEFNRAGATVQIGSGHLGLTLAGIGRGATLKLVGRVTPKAQLNRVTYSRPGVREWYVNGPLGLEQEFTVEAPPARRAPGLLTLSLGLSGNMTVRVARGGQSATLGRAGRVVLSYGGLIARDARGRVLRSWMQLRQGRLDLRIATRGASYPLQVDPLVQQAKLAPATPGEFNFGQDVALSADGNTALVAIAGPAAYVFSRVGSAWTKTEELRPSQLVAPLFSSAEVTLSSDGETAVIGGPGDYDERGAAWVFAKSGSVWSQEAELTGGEEEIGNGQFGSSVALSADGARVLVGAPFDNSGVGRAWEFTNTSGSWSVATLFSGAEELGAGTFGSSVAISGSGTTALIGGPEGGEVWGFVRSGSFWAYIGGLTDGAGFHGFGTSIALSYDGTSALVGEPSANDSTGEVWAFSRSGAEWATQGPPLKAGDESGASQMGESVALSADGTIALIGGAEDDDYSGGAWLFQHTGTTWAQAAPKLTESDEMPFFGASSYGGFGWAVALSSSGDTALIGDPKNDGFEGDTTVLANGVAEPGPVSTPSTGQRSSAIAPPSPTTTTKHVTFSIVGPFKVAVSAVVLGGKELRIKELVVLGTSRGERVLVTCHGCRGQSRLQASVAHSSRTVLRPRNLIMPESAKFVVSVTAGHMLGRFRTYGRFKVSHPTHASPKLTWGYTEPGCLVAGGSKEVACPR